MGLRKRVSGLVSSFISIAVLVRATAQMTHFVQETGDEDATDLEESEVYGDSALLSRAPAGGDELFVDLEGERVIFGTRETRWMVTLSEGDTVLRALGADTRAYLRLRKNGDIELVGGGDNSPTNYVAIATLVDAQFKALKTAISSAAVVAQDGGASFESTLMAALATWPAPVASKHVKAV